MAPRTRQSQTAPAQLHLNITAKLKSEQGRKFGAICVALDPILSHFCHFVLCHPHMGALVPAK